MTSELGSFRISHLQKKLILDVRAKQGEEGDHQAPKGMGMGMGMRRFTQVNPMCPILTTTIKGTQQSNDLEVLFNG